MPENHKTLTTRERAIELVAKQLAVFNGIAWPRLEANPKLKAPYITLAAGLVATVERQQGYTARWPDISRASFDA